MVSQNIIARGSVIPGAKNDDFHPDGESHCQVAQPAVAATVTLTNAQVRGLPHSEIEVVPGIPGKRLWPLGVYYEKAAGAYTGGSGFVVEYISNQQWVVDMPEVAMRSGTAETGWGVLRPFTGTPEDRSFPSGGLQIASGGGFQGTGGGQLEITVVYLEVNE